MSKVLTFIEHHSQLIDMGLYGEEEVATTREIFSDQGYLTIWSAAVGILASIVVFVIR